LKTGVDAAGIAEVFAVVRELDLGGHRSPSCEVWGRL
jgi:hypothetical protein